MLMRMNVTITQKQFELLVESVQGTLFDVDEVEISNIYKRCAAAKKLKIKDSPWCPLKDLYTSLTNQNLKDRLEKSISTLVKHYGWKNYGVLPSLITVALKDPNRTISDLETLAEFFEDQSYSHKNIKKILKNMDSTQGIPDKQTIEKLYSEIKKMASFEYEKSWVGPQFDKKTKKLELSYRCENNMDYKFFELITDVQSGKRQKIQFLNDFKKCIESSLKEPKYFEKSDLFLKNDLYIIDPGGQKEKVLDGGNYEVKKFDPLVDSHLSEFFSIFKESGLKSIKSQYLQLYNKIVDEIYVWIKNNDQGYLEKVKSNMKGICFNDYLIIPIKYIELYWSNQGQRGCEEKRITIRYRINPNVKMSDIEVYKYKYGSDIVEKVPNSQIKFESLIDEKKVCDLEP